MLSCIELQDAKPVLLCECSDFDADQDRPKNTNLMDYIMSKAAKLSYNFDYGSSCGNVSDDGQAAELNSTALENWDPANDVKFAASFNCVQESTENKAGTTETNENLAEIPIVSNAEVIEELSSGNEEEFPVKRKRRRRKKSDAIQIENNRTRMVRDRALKKRTTSKKLETSKDPQGIDKNTNCLIALHTNFNAYNNVPFFPENRYECPITGCGKSFKNKSNVKTHLKALHEEHHESAAMCELCGVTMKHQISLAVHMSSVHYGYRASFKHYCDFCGYGYNDEDEFKLHKEKHTSVANISAFQCVFCPELLANLPGLKRHTLSCHVMSDTIPKCDICGKVYSSQSTLTIHSKTHADDALRCSQCPRVCTSNADLEKHKQIHSKDRIRYNCHLCPATYVSKTTLKYHIERIHEKKITMYACKICGKEYNRKNPLRRHEVLHSGKVFPCPHCGKGFPNSEYVYQHLRGHCPKQKDGEITEPFVPKKRKTTKKVKTVVEETISPPLKSDDIIPATFVSVSSSNLVNENANFLTNTHADLQNNEMRTVGLHTNEGLNVPLNFVDRRFIQPQQMHSLYGSTTHFPLVQGALNTETDSLFGLEPPTTTINNTYYM